MANEIAGYKARLKLSTSTGGSVSALASLRNFRITHSMNPIDVTTHESSGISDFIAGVSQWDGSAELFSVTSNATHKAVFDVLSGKTKVDGEFLPTGSSSDGYYSGSLFVTSWGLNSPETDGLGASVNFQGTGALTRSSSST